MFITLENNPARTFFFGGHHQALLMILKVEHVTVDMPMLL